MKFLIELILFFIPRFITEDVAVALCPDGDYEIVCSMEDINFEAGERYDGVITLNSFTFLGWAFPTGYMDTDHIEVRPWPEAKPC